jgi:hypothetical protein
VRKQLIITDLTRMQGDRVCIFGVDAGGRGIRPVTAPPGIQEDYLCDRRGQRVIRPFAVIEFDLVRSRAKPPHTEDWEINPRYAPKLIRCLSEDESREFLERILDRSVRSIFGADVHGNQYMNEGEGHRSLGTVIATEVLSVVHCFTEYERYEYRIKFSDVAGEIYDLPVTDLAFREYCDRLRLQGYTTATIGAELGLKLRRSRVFIRVGLARPFAKMFNRCYLQVCAIHAFPRYAENAGRTGSCGVSGADCRSALSVLAEVW